MTETFTISDNIRWVNIHNGKILQQAWVGSEGSIRWEDVKVEGSDSKHGMHCPKCNSSSLILFSSLRYKLCAACNHKWPWELKEGQKPVI